MKTLLEYITFIKGVEYLIVVAFGFGFIAFWLLVHNRQIEAKKIVSIVIPLSLIFSGAAVVLATNDGTGASGRSLSPAAAARGPTSAPTAGAHRRRRPGPPSP